MGVTNIEWTLVQIRDTAHSRYRVMKSACFKPHLVSSPIASTRFCANRMCASLPSVEQLVYCSFLGRASGEGGLFGKRRRN
jgi:hypothetical protein